MAEDKKEKKEESLYTRAAKSGYLGSRAKVEAERPKDEKKKPKKKVKRAY